MRRELEPAVVEFRKHVTGKQVALGRMRIARKNEGAHTGSFEFFDLAEHLVRITDDGSAST